MLPSWGNSCASICDKKQLWSSFTSVFEHQPIALHIALFDMIYLSVLIVTCSLSAIDTKKWHLATDDSATTKDFMNFEPRDGRRYDHILQLTRKPHENNSRNTIQVMSPTYINRPEDKKQILHKTSNEEYMGTQFMTNLTVNQKTVFRPSIQYEVAEYAVARSKVRKPRKHLKTNRTNQFNKTRQSKFLEVFEVVEFDHEVCISSSGLEGTCLHEFDCQGNHGSAMGSCADGLGTCCVILFNCDSTTSAHIGWFVNPNFPSPSSDRLSCTISLEKISNDIKQFRLDLTNFEILPPSSGTCEQDQFSVTGQDANIVIPILCGINSGQHIYIEVGNTDGPINLSIQTLSEENRLFSIKVTQLTAVDDLAAPTGCLQYYRGEHGHIESFNYRDRSEIGITRTSSYFNNLNYAMCIKRPSTSCTITYTNVGEMQIVNYDTDGTPLIPPRQAGVEIYNCPSDWLLLAAVRLCGERLNDGAVLQDFSLDAPVTDDGAGPIVVWFRSDGVYAGRGFNLHYQQNLCSIPT